MTPSHRNTSWFPALASSCGLAFALLAGCSDYGPVGSGSAPSAPLNCDDGIKTAFKPDANTSVVAVRSIKAGDRLIAVDSAAPITAAVDMCLVKLLVGPGVPSQPPTAPSFSDGIGIEIWLPARASWNERIRNYGGGGWVGGGHRYADQIGSKVPALVNANMGYAVGTTDAGQPLYQDGSFILKTDGRINRDAFRDFSYRAMVEQATKTRALVKLYYGKAQKFAYFDGHSQGGRQGLKVAQNYPELYDGYMIAAPAIDQEKFGLARLYVQIVLKNDLGFSAVDSRCGEGVRGQGERRECARGGCMRQGASRLSDRSVPVRLRPGQGCRRAVCRRVDRRRGRQQHRRGQLRDGEGSDRDRQDLVRSDQRRQL